MKLCDRAWGDTVAADKIFRHLNTIFYDTRYDVLINQDNVIMLIILNKK